MLQMNRTVDYALRSLIYLSLHGNSDLARIALHQRIPPAYLAKIMKRLARFGLVRSTVGREGGYHLRRAPDHITLREVIEAVEGTLSLFECYHGNEECFFIDRNCTVKNYWETLESEIRRILEKTTLADILPRVCLAEDSHVHHTPPAPSRNP